MLRGVGSELHDEGVNRKIWLQEVSDICTQPKSQDRSRQAQGPDIRLLRFAALGRECVRLSP